MTSASGPAGRLVPGELDTLPGDIELNAGRPTVRLTVANTGDRPIQVGSHYHFFETNDALSFDRPKAYGFRLDIPAGTAVRFEPGQTRDVDLVALAGARVVYGFAGRVMGPLDKVPQRPKKAPAAKAPASRGAAGKPAGRTTKAPAGTKKAPATRKPGAAGAKSKKGAGR